MGITPQNKPQTLNSLLLATESVVTNCNEATNCNPGQTVQLPMSNPPLASNLL